MNCTNFKTFAGAQATKRAGSWSNPRYILFMAFACILAACCAVFAAPVCKASAKSYTMPEVNITAQLNSDGSLHVVEQRTFEFDGNYSAVWWTFSNIPDKGNLKVNGIRSISSSSSSAQSSTNANASQAKTLEEVPFELKWREEGGPAHECYSVDSGKNTAYVFFETSPENIVLEIDYTIANMAQIYEDVSELNWQYVGTQWESASENVTLSLQLPVPNGTQVQAGSNVRAWGHGPSEGNVDVQADGIIKCSVPKVKSGDYAEVRVTTPKGWISNASDAAVKLHAGQSALDDILKDEQTWADTENAKRTQALMFIIGCAIVCLLSILWAVYAFLRFGREHKPEFTGKYWRDVPQKNIHPAVIGRLWRWDKESTQDLTATIMHLANKGAIEIKRGSYTKKGLLGREKTADDYYICRSERAGELTNLIDIETMKLLFDNIAGGSDTLWFNTLKAYGKEHSESFVNACKTWQGKVSMETNKCDFFEQQGKRRQKIAWVLATCLLFASIGVWYLTSNMLPVFFAVPTVVVLAVLGNYMTRRSMEANNLVAKCKALRNWLRDFSSLDERPPTDVKVWGEFMVYAYLFGVAKQAIEQLRIAEPELFETDDALGYSYVPWWAWYYHSPNGAFAGLDDVGSFFESSFNSAFETASEAVQAASGGFSSGGGFGGGFSGGGGGGFGGGGGGAR